jgi:hypothetical protein
MQTNQFHCEINFSGVCSLYAQQARKMITFDLEVEEEEEEDNDDEDTEA